MSMGAVVSLMGEIGSMGTIGGSKEAIVGLVGAVGSRARTNTAWAWLAAYPMASTRIARGAGGPAVE